MKFQQFILLGLPGVGVEAQASELAKRKQLPHVSLETLLQTATAAQSDGEQIVPTYSEVGNPISDEQMITLIRRRLEQPDVMLNGWVLEGFPQTVTQAEAYENLGSKLELPAPTVVHLQAMTGLLMNRLWEQRQPGDTVSAIRQRIEQQQQQLMPLLTFYEERSQLTTLNGSLPFAELAGKLSRLGLEAASAARMIHDEAELDALIAQEPLLVVDGMASWCGSCRLVMPMMEQLATAYGDRVKVMKMDFEVNQQIPKRFSLKGLPAVMFFKDGELQETLTGVKPYQTYSATVSRFLE